MTTSKLSGNATLDKRVYNLKLEIGAAGAIATDGLEGENILSAVKEAGNGTYTIELADLGQSLEEVIDLNVTSSGAGLQVLVPFKTADNLPTNSKFTVAMLNSAGALTNPTSGNFLHIVVGVKVAAQ